MAMLAGPPEGLRVPLTGVTHWEQQLDTSPVPSMGRVQQRRRVVTGRVNLGMVDERGHGGSVAIPGGVL
jgi:hypothetical protein